VEVVTWPRVLRLTSEELTAIARGLGAAQFPVVPVTRYDAVAAELHPLLDEAFLASLTARGLLLPDEDEDLVPSGELANLLAVVTPHRVRVAVEQVTATGELVTCELLAADRGIVRHWVGDPIHVFEFGSTDTGTGPAIAAALAAIVQPSPGDAQPGRRRRRGRLSELADLMTAPRGGWHRSTMMARTDNPSKGALVEAFLGVLDGGPGDLWLVRHEDTETGEEPEVFVEPASAAEVEVAIRALPAPVASAR
jgi:hypothetical protein